MPPDLSFQVMMGGAWFHETYGSPETVTEESLLPIATQAVRSQLGITAAPRWSRVMLHRVGQRWPECVCARACSCTWWHCFSM